MTDRLRRTILGEEIRTGLVARAFVVVLLGLSLYLLYLVFRPFLPGIAWAIFLATAFHPVYSALLRLSRGREWACAIITTLLITALIVLPTLMIVTTFTRTVSGMFENIDVSAGETMSTKPSAPSELSRAGGIISQKFPAFQKIETLLGRYTDIASLDLEGALMGSIKKLGQTLAAQTSPLLHNMLRTLLAFIVMVVTMTVLFKEGPKLIATARRFLPLTATDKDAVFTRLHETSRAVFYGVMMTALVQAILGTIGWAIVGLPAPATFGMAMFFCALIPVGGTSLVWGPGAIYLFVQDHPGRALTLALWGLLVVGMIDNILKPIFISGRTRLHMLLVFFGIFGGITAFGLAGLFLGPLVITLFLFLLEVVRRDLFPSDETHPTKESPKEVPVS